MSGRCGTNAQIAVCDWIFSHVKSADSPREKTLMLSPRDLDRLKARTKALRREAEAPFISIDVWREGEEPPPEKTWQLRIKIENQKPLC